MARKILLADDSVTAQNMGRKILVDAGYEVVTVNNGSAALKRVHESKPDLIVLDVYMPGYSGLEVCQRLKEAGETAHIPILLTVGKLEPFKPDEARRVRADAHIVKPFEASELLSAMARLEDRIAPAPDGRWASATGSARKASDDLESGWKERLRFPSPKKKGKAESKTDGDDATAAFRDFHPGKSKTSYEPPADKAAAAAEPELVPDIPRDITPEELDALSALAARMDGRTPEQIAPATDTSSPAAEQITPAAETPSPAAAEAADPAMEIAEAPAETVGASYASAASAPEAEAMEAQPERDEPAEAEVAASSESNLPHATGEPAEETAPAPTLETESKIEVPQSGVPEVETSTIEASTMEAATSADVVAVNAAQYAEEAAPVDPQDEPIFSTVPSDEELKEALVALTPSATHIETPDAVSGAQLGAEQTPGEAAAGNASGSSRWIAEGVALTPEEASMSLEAEMFHTFAAKAAAELRPAEVENQVPATNEGFASSLDKMENLDSASLVDLGAKLVSELTREPASAPAAETASVEATATEMAAEAEREEPVPPAKEPVVEAVSEPVPELEKIKAMAAAAAAEDASAAEPDPNAIANIVDRVLADLRPKIVEEIAKKLGGK